MKFWPNLKHSPTNRLVAMMLLSLLMLVGLSSQPAHAKFISADPVTALQHLQNGNVQGFTPYVYANNNPYKFTDPDGRMPLLAPAVLFLGKEAAGEAFEQATGIPAPTVKNLGKAAVKQVAKSQLTPQARGRASEKRVLKDIGLDKNTHKVSSPEGNAIPDALTNKSLVEIKDTKRVSMTKQLRIEVAAAKENQLKSVLITGDNTKVSKTVVQQFNKIQRREDLGPKK